MMLKKGEIKTEGVGKGRRKRISEAAAPQTEGIATTIRDANYGRKMGRHKPGKLVRKKKSRRLTLEASGENALVKRERRELPSIRVSVDGAVFVRAHEEGKGRSQEVLLRHGNNLRNLVREVRRVTFAALFDGTYKPEDDTMIACNRHLTLIQGLCTEKGALNASRFETTKGKPFKGYFGFGMMVRQFFRDVDFAGKVVGWASREYSEMKAAKPCSIIPSTVRMAPASATVGGVLYTRTFPPNDFAAEEIVRHNLEKFVRGAMEAAKLAVEQERRPSDAHLYCYPPESEVLDMTKFETLDSKPVRDEALFSRAITQFFCDTEMVNKIIRQALGKK